MNLNSFIFLLFVLLAVTVYYLIPKRTQWIWLLLVSYVYYFANAGWALIFILVTTVTTWYAALSIDQTESDRKRRTITALTLLLNFGILGVLKYTNFAVNNINSLLHLNLPVFKWMLPLGISFYTFQSMGYLLDVCWKRQKVEKNLMHFALFVSFFPQLVAGPIERSGNLLSQIRRMEKEKLTSLAKYHHNGHWC